MDPDYKQGRKQVSMDQMTGLLAFLQDHPNLSKGLVRGRRGKIHSLEQWNQCAKKLNAIEDGATKDGKGWSKYWCDWKYRVRRKALELKAARENNLPLPEGTVPLSDLEDCILALIGDGAVDKIIIKTDPLEIDEETDANENIAENMADGQYHEPEKPSKRRHSPAAESDDDGGSPPEQRARIEENDSDTEPERLLEDQDAEAASEFIRLEKEKLENSRRITETLITIASELRRIGDVMTHIRDVLLNNRMNL